MPLSLRFCSRSCHIGNDWVQKPFLISTMEPTGWVQEGWLLQATPTANIGLPGILWLPGRCLHPFPSSPFLKHGILSALAGGPVTEAVWHAGFQPYHRRDWEPAFPSALLCSCLGHAVGQWVGRLWVLLCSQLILILSSSQISPLPGPKSRATQSLLPSAVTRCVLTLFKTSF